MKFKPLLLRIKKDIDRAEIVSFDVFDTLLLRPYLEPMDLFTHIERAKNIPCFCVDRYEAELKARRRNQLRENVTFDEIYGEIDENFRSLKQTELDWEMMVLRQNPEMKQVWDYVKSTGKTIIVASDMYLPTDFIAKALEKNGYSGYDHLYVSGELGKTKARGTLYGHILAELGISPGNMLHIGDNEESDYRQPKKLGIRAVRYRQVKAQFFRHNRRARFFGNELGYNLGASIMLMVLAMRWHRKMLGLLETSYWEDLGYEYAGPVAYGYSRFIESEVKADKSSQILFVARDGYTLQKVFNTFNSGIRTDYVYAPRFLNLFYRLDYSRLWDKKYIKDLVDYYRVRSPQLAALAESTKLEEPIDHHMFISENRKLFEAAANREFAHYGDYLSKIVSDRSVKIYSVDTSTANFSSQRLIEDVLGMPVIGLYWSISQCTFNDISGSRQFRYNFSNIYDNRQFVGNTRVGFEFGDTVDVNTKNWDFMEFLLTAPEYPVKNITADGQPVYDSDPSDYEKTRKKLYSVVSDNALTFAEDVKEMFNGTDIFLSGKVLVKWVNYFCDNPTPSDIENISVMRHAGGISHEEYRPVFSTRISLFQALRHPIKAIRELKMVPAPWRTGLQTLILCIAKPLRVRIRGLKQICIIILPRLEKRLFTFSLNLSRKCFYQIIVGNKESKK
jgi:HAD superfamily hydrolase (TIGR01549 family)